MNMIMGFTGTQLYRIETEHADKYKSCGQSYEFVRSTYYIVHTKISKLTFWVEKCSFECLNIDDSGSNTG